MEIIQCFHLYSKLFLFHTKLAKSRESIVSWLGTKKLIRYRKLSLNISKAGKLDQKAENSMVLSNFLNGYTSVSLFSYSLCSHSAFVLLLLLFFFYFLKKVAWCTKNCHVLHKNLCTKKIFQREIILCSKVMFTK